MKRKTRTIIGIILILSAAAMMVFWETKGREQIRTTPLLVAARDLQPGELAEENMFAKRRAGEEDRIKGALQPEELQKILGSRILYPIPENSQIIEDSFGSPRHFIEEDQGIFLIRGEWIFSVSSSLRKGDWVRIYGLEGAKELGAFQVAFVKDNQGQEVTALEEGIRKGETEVLERTHGTGPVDHLEILCDIENYIKIVDYLFARDNAGEFVGDDILQSRGLIIRQEEQKEGMAL